MDRILVFDIWGEYAHFRKYYTTTSPLTFSVPPRTALCGFIAGMIGLDKTDYLKYFTKDKANIAVRILNPIKKVRLAENLIDTKIAPMMSRIKTRTQIRFELLKDARYRIYFHHTDPDKYLKAHEYLAQHKSVYTPCLGLSEHIANFKFVGEFGCKSIDNCGDAIIDSVVPLSDHSPVKVNFDKVGEYFSETIPIEMAEDRTVLEYTKIMFERNGAPISISLSKCWEIESNERILFL